MLFTFAVALGTGLVFGLVPAWLTARSDPNATLRSTSARAGTSSGQARLRNALVVVEMALALILLSGAGLMIRTFANLVRTDPGFDMRHALSAEIWLTGSHYDSPATTSEYYRTLLTRLQALPGVKSAAVVEAGLPLERGGNISVFMNGQRLQGGVDYRTVTPGYFRTLGVALTQGRDFTSSDDGAAVPVVVVNQAFAHRYLHDGALGRGMTVGGSDSTVRTVVGVTGDIKSYIGQEPPAIVYIPSPQTPAGFTRIFNGWFPIHVLVRASGDPAAIAGTVASAVRAVDPQVPVGQVRPMADVLGASLALQRFVMVVLTAFAALAIALATIGIYGLISWFVMRSTRDIGVRMALGARPRDVTRLVVRRGMVLALTGAAIGVAGALILSRLLESMLFEVRPADPATLAGVTLVLVVLAAIACYIPARRAAGVDPVVSLRAE
jgi:predicted permease